MATTSSEAPSRDSAAGPSQDPYCTDDHRGDEANQNGLSSRDIGPLRVLLTSSSGHQRGGPHAETDRQGKDQRQERLGESDGGHGVGSQSRDKEDVADGEHRLHDHLQHHGNGQQNDGATQAPFREILLGALDGLSEGLPEGGFPCRGPDRGRAVHSRDGEGSSRICSERISRR